MVNRFLDGKRAYLCTTRRSAYAATPKEMHASRRNDRLASPTRQRRQWRRQMFPSLPWRPATPTTIGRQGRREGRGPRPKSVNKLLWISSSSLVCLSHRLSLCRGRGWKLGVPQSGDANQNQNNSGIKRGPQTNKGIGHGGL